MGKKRRKQKKNAVLEEQQNQKKKYLFPLIVIGVLAVLILTVFFTKDNNQTGMPEKPARALHINLIETNPVLSSSMFYGRTALAYRHASEIPEVVDNQFCYCYCRKNFNHKTLLTCFTGDHGANCSICQNEVFRSYQLNKEGLSISEITTKIDKEFYRKQM